MAAANSLWNWGNAMRIRVAKDWRYRWTMSFDGKTMAEKKSTAAVAERLVCGEWCKGMDAVAGQFVPVDTEFLFENQFNTPDGIGSKNGLRVMAREIDAVDFSPEFEDVDEFMEAVAERYSRDWPGMELSSEFPNRIAQGTIEDLTPKGKRCDQCAAAYINGVFCHEIGCPNMHKVWSPVDGTWDVPDREED